MALLNVPIAANRSFKSLFLKTFFEFHVLAFRQWPPISVVLFMICTRFDTHWPRRRCGRDSLAQAIDFKHVFPSIRKCKI